MRGSYFPDGEVNGGQRWKHCTERFWIKLSEQIPRRWCMTDKPINDFELSLLGNEDKDAGVPAYRSQELPDLEWHILGANDWQAVSCRHRAVSSSELFPNPKMLLTFAAPAPEPEPRPVVNAPVNPYNNNLQMGGFQQQPQMGFQQQPQMGFQQQPQMGGFQQQPQVGGFVQMNQQPMAQPMAQPTAQPIMAMQRSCSPAPPSYQKQEAAGNSFCTQCGTTYVVGTAFCEQCGNRCT